VGDRFHEMYSFWVYVVAIEDPIVWTMEASPPCTFPDDGKVRMQSRDELVSRFEGASKHGPWIMLCDRGNDVSGWLYGERRPAPSRPETEPTLGGSSDVRD
jgi:hypothetical protein